MEIENLKIKLKILKKYRKLKVYGEGLKTLDDRQADKKARELANAQQTIEEYLRQEQIQDHQKKKRNDLE